MKLKEEAKVIFNSLLGPEVAKLVDSFDDPKKYPKEFLDECMHFLANFVGEESAKKKFEPIYQKYNIKTE
jgi:hypothetical protein